MDSPMENIDSIQLIFTIDIATLMSLQRLSNVGIQHLLQEYNITHDHN